MLFRYSLLAAARQELDAMDAENVQRQINETVRFANNEMLSNISELLDNRLADMQRNISENQKAIAEKQEARMEKWRQDKYNCY